jgi:hypothetical protein
VKIAMQSTGEAALQVYTGGRDHPTPRGSRILQVVVPYNRSRAHAQNFLIFQIVYQYWVVLVKGQRNA